MPKYVICPESFAPLFDTAEELLTPFFNNFVRNPEEGSNTIDKARYVFYRGDSMAIAMKQQLTSVLGPGAGVVIYQIGKAIGASDAKHYFEKTGVQDPAQRLALGPVVFALSGYANVTVQPETIAVQDENFMLVVDHPNSYEAEAHLKTGLPIDAPVDFLNAGYAAGWCSEAFSLKLEGKEIACKAMGAAQCRFVVAPARRLRGRVKEMKALYNL